RQKECDDRSRATRAANEVTRTSQHAATVKRNELPAPPESASRDEPVGPMMRVVCCLVATRVSASRKRAAQVTSSQAHRHVLHMCALCFHRSLQRFTAIHKSNSIPGAPDA